MHSNLQRCIHVRDLKLLLASRVMRNFEAIAAAAQPLEVMRNGERVPAVYWMPDDGHQGTVLALHGGSGHKLSPAILAIVQACLHFKLAVLAIDGPVHGDRRSDGNLDSNVARDAFRRAWREGVGRTSIAADWQAVLDAWLARPANSTLPVGYVGVSMGTAYGIPLLANEPRIRAAVLGLWGTTYAASEHLASFAACIQCPVWFTMQWDDELFDHAGTFELFDAIGCANKRLVAYPGPHRELEGERLDDAIQFVAKQLLQG